jgi:hypothetical protein
MRLPEAALQGQGKYADATAACQRAFPLRPDSAEALCGLSAVRAVFST